MKETDRVCNAAKWLRSAVHGKGVGERQDALAENGRFQLHQQHIVHIECVRERDDVEVVPPGVLLR